MTRAIASPRRLTRAPRTRLRLDRLEDRAVPALVAALAFNEGTGPTAADASGSGNVGTLTGASWIAGGRYGGALSFDGTNDWVTVADAASLDLTTGMTLEAWVRPSAINGWETVLLKEMAGPDWRTRCTQRTEEVDRRPDTSFVGSDRAVVGSAVLPLNAWTHLATTYDGAIQRLYVNGTPVATRAHRGSITTSTGALRIGGNSVWGEYFSGLIDEVRVYNHALTQAQIQADMNTPMAPIRTPRPRRSAPSPAHGDDRRVRHRQPDGPFSEGMDPATVTAATVELRNSAGAGRTAAVSYNAATRTATLDPNASLAVSTVLHRETVRGGPTGVKDAAGNPLAADFTWSFSTGSPVFQDVTVFSGLVNPTVVKFSRTAGSSSPRRAASSRCSTTWPTRRPRSSPTCAPTSSTPGTAACLGMALAPNFPPSRTSTSCTPSTPTPTAPRRSGGRPASTATRCPTRPGRPATAWSWTGDCRDLSVNSNGTAGAEQVLVEKQWLQQFPSHSIGTVAFGLDGQLYASAGDGASFNYVDYGQTSPQPTAPEPRNPASMGDPANEGGALRSQDLRSPCRPDHAGRLHHPREPRHRRPHVQQPAVLDRQRRQRQADHRPRAAQPVPLHDPPRHE